MRGRRARVAASLRTRRDAGPARRAGGPHRGGRRAGAGGRGGAGGRRCRPGQRDRGSSAAVAQAPQKILGGSPSQPWDAGICPRSRRWSPKRSPRLAALAPTYTYDALAGCERATYVAVVPRHLPTAAGGPRPAAATRRGHAPRVLRRAGDALRSARPGAADERVGQPRERVTEPDVARRRAVGGARLGAPVTPPHGPPRSARRPHR